MSIAIPNRAINKHTKHYPFGMLIQERTYTATVEGYRFGFNGMEKVDEVSGSGNAYDFGARIYDSRLGRWMSVDPLQKKYPSLSPYNFVANSPILFIDPDGRVIDLGNLTPEQKIQYKALLDKLSKSELHNYVQNALESSSNTYIIVIDNDMKAGGSFNPETGVIKMNLTVMNNVPEIASEEMFHAYQKDRLGENHSEVSKQNIEAEGDLYVLYVQNELYGELGLRVDFGHLDNDLVADLGVNDGTTTSEDMSTEDYQSLYGQLVQKRYEKYKDDPKAPSSYKKEPSGDASSTLIKATKEKEANEQKLEGPKLENVDYYGS